jgi:spermidine synthase
VTLSIEVSEEHGVRYLHFGSSWIQGAMRIARPAALELEYTRDMMFPLLLRGGGWPRTVLLIGLGAASLTRFLYKHRPRAAQTVVEIEPAVIAVARQHFKLPPESARLRIVIGDGSDYLQAADRDFDLILVDGYDAKGRTGMLDTLPFYCNCRAHLTSRGVLAANLLTRGQRGSFDRLRAAFEGRVIALPKASSGNLVMIAAAGERAALSDGDLLRRARRLRRETGLDLVPTVTKWLEARSGPALRL